MKETAQRLAPTTIFLHWVVGLFIIVLMAVGFYMDTFEVFSLYPLHKSFGVIVLVLAAVRLLWRLAKGFPPPASNYAAWERTLARIVQWVLLLGTILFPLSGIIMSAMGGNGVAVFGVGLFPMNPGPPHPGKKKPIDQGHGRQRTRHARPAAVGDAGGARAARGGRLEAPPAGRRRHPAPHAGSYPLIPECRAAGRAFLSEKGLSCRQSKPCPTRYAGWLLPG